MSEHGNQSEPNFTASECQFNKHFSPHTLIETYTLLTTHTLQIQVTNSYVCVNRSVGRRLSDLLLTVMLFLEPLRCFHSDLQRHQPSVEVLCALI